VHAPVSPSKNVIAARNSRGTPQNEHSIAKSNQKEGLPTEIQCSATRIGDNNNSLSAQLEAIRANGICTMEMIQSLVVMVSKLSSEVN
jgi:5,10-methylenetetrahydrofolate reductase